MKNRKAVAAATVILILCLLLPFVGKLSNKEPYDIIVFGDSIMAGVYEESTVPSLLEEMSGYRVLNAAFGGTTMAYVNDGPYAGNNKAFFSMASLSEAFRYNDFSFVRMSSLSSHDFTQDTWREKTETLSKTDFHKAKIVVIEHGCNDYQCGALIENSKDPYDRTTFSGALRWTVENIRKGVPNAEIILMTPIFCHVEGYDACTVQDFGGGTLDKYAEAVIKVACEYGVTVIDNYSESGIDEDNYKDFLADGVHLTDAGSRLIAERLWNVIEIFVNDQR